MRGNRLTLIALAAAATAGAAFAQQPVATYSPPSAREFNGGAEGYGAQTTHSAYGADARGPQAVYAVIARHVVRGDIQPGSRLLSLADEQRPQFTCRVFHRQADIALACSDGSVAQLSMSSPGCGQSHSGEPASLCIGLKAKSAARRLVAPPGYTLVGDDGVLTLTPKGA
jgi:hypothetical protein